MDFSLIFNLVLLSLPVVHPACWLKGVHDSSKGTYNASACISSGGDRSRVHVSNKPEDTIRTIQFSIDQFCVVGDISSSVGVNPDYIGVGDEDPRIKEILATLYKGKTISRNAYRDFTVSESSDGLKEETEKITSSWNNSQPDQFARNPWFIEVTGISFRREKLKNWLHFRIFQNRSVSDDKPKLHDKTSPQDFQQSDSEKHDRSKGRFIYALLMVTDQDGWPVGDFSKQLPCARVCHIFGDKNNVYHATDDNNVPCAYTPWTSATHPGMLVFGSKEFNSNSGLVGVRELHASWSFTQTSCHFVTELHFQGLLLEDLTVIPFLYDKMDLRVNHYMAWPLRYDVYFPTKLSLGAPDYVPLKYFMEREAYGYELNCHVDLSNDETFVKGVPPESGADYSAPNPPRNPENIPLQSVHMWHLGSIGVRDGWKRYYGIDYPPQTCRDLKIGGNIIKPKYATRENLRKVVEEVNAIPKGEEFFKSNLKIRCPCPQLPSDELSSKYPSAERIYIRKLHASHMCIAFMTLLPLAVWVIRYYKETFNSVFCLQEWWWFMWHVWLLFIALMFIFGAILSVEVIKYTYGGKPIEMSLLAWFHIICGSVTIFLFLVQLVLGFLRPADVRQRKITIFVHWFLGLLVFLGAVATIATTAWIQDSGLSCKALKTGAAWLIILIIFICIMEINMYLEDKKLKLDPKRSYLPPPTKRMFAKDTPGVAFRMAMLLILMIFLMTCQILMTKFIWAANGTSCFGHSSHNGSEDGGGGRGGDPEENYYYENDDTFFFD